jgi:hypothetical protein
MFLVTTNTTEFNFLPTFFDCSSTISNGRLAMSSRKGARAGGEKGATWVQE